MSRKLCAVTFGVVGAALLALLVAEIPGAIRELKAIRMAKWKHE